MKRFSLELLYHIVGIGSASGLFYKDGSIFIASDNAGYLYEFNTVSQVLSKSKLLNSHILENIPKRQKPDFEAVAEKDGNLYLFGSGSTDKRNTAFVVDLKTRDASTRNLTDLYANMRQVSDIDADNFNIEGAVASEGRWYFFQRGNGQGGNNGIFEVTGDLENFRDIKYFAKELPRIEHVNTSFTDAVFADGAFWFLASAEDTNSTYEDGEVLGSLIGKIDPQSMEIVFSQQITDTHKLEGLTFYSKTATGISFLLCEDNDTDMMESEIFKITLQLD